MILGLPAHFSGIGHDATRSDDRTDNFLRRCDSECDLRVAVSVDAGNGI
jgi:hypothetical protein